MSPSPRKRTLLSIPVKHERMCYAIGRTSPSLPPLPAFILLAGGHLNRAPALKALRAFVSTGCEPPARDPAPRPKRLRLAA